MRRRFALVCWLLLIVGLIGLVLGVFLDTRRFLFSYLTAWAFFVSTAIGSLMLLMIGHAARARWFAGLRRLAEFPAALMPLFALLAIPFFLGLPQLYDWARPLQELPPETRALVEHKAAWMNVPFFIVRTVAWIAIFSFFSVFLVRGSLRLDRGFDDRLQLRLQRVASAGIPICSFALTWASFDWLMSLDTTWYSSIFGVYFFAGGFVAALALLNVLAVAFRSGGLLPEQIAAEHSWAVGRLLFGFVIFWAYQGFAQLLIIWIGNIPHEVSFFMRRVEGGWAWVSFALVAGQFVLPFLILLSRDLKRNPAALVFASIWLLVFHYVDVYWMVIPNLHPDAVAVHWLDLCALFAVFGALGLLALLRFRGVSAVPASDPYYWQSLRYQGWP